MFVSHMVIWSRYCIMDLFAENYNHYFVAYVNIKWGFIAAVADITHFAFGYRWGRHVSRVINGNLYIFEYFKMFNILWLLNMLKKSVWFLTLGQMEADLFSLHTRDKRNSLQKHFWWELTRLPIDHTSSFLSLALFKKKKKIKLHPSNFGRSVASWMTNQNARSVCPWGRK